ncbi:MAG: hypothetical protein K2K97_10825, partial [Muribaculaceae bacterium]|nr:hypothetical protein [Muribaculaceae bacterium]
PLDELEANKPYLLIKDAAQPAAAKSIKAAEATEDNAYHIYGWSTNKEDLGDGEKNIMLGSLTDYTPDYLHYHLQTDELGNVGFVLHDPNDANSDSGQIDQYHACIKTALTPEGFAETDNLVMQGFYFVEPMQTWAVELEEGRYGTIVLPFEAPLPEALVAVEMTGVSDVRNALTHSYQIAELSEPAEKLEAHVPYLVRSNDASKTIFTFEGVAENDVEEFSPEGNLLTGLFKSRDGQYYNENKKRDKLEAGHWVLTTDDDNHPMFVKTTEETELAAYSAYICNPEVMAALNKMAVRAHLLAEEGEEETVTPATPTADVIYLNEDHAKNTIEWSMETADYGTIILPFEAEIPEGLEAYEVSAPAENAEVEKMPTQADQGKSYQLLQKVEATTLEANKTYLMMKKAPAVEEPGTEENTPLSIKAASSEVYTFTGTPDANLDPEATGVMQGTYAEKAVGAGDYLLNDEGKGFEKLVSEASVDAHHGYISKDSLTDAPDYLVLAEPESDMPTNVDAIMAGEENVDIFTLQGVCVARDVNAAETLRTLEPGIYVLRSGDKTVKVIK